MDNRYIICYGRAGELDIITAPSFNEAFMIATARSIDDGILDDELPDTTWVEPYTDAKAEELGLK
jgi:hypothetical protein